MKTPFRIAGVPRSYLRLASVYRRFAGRRAGFDFSAAALVECFEHESNGSIAQRDNGYVFGKWAKDITVATWREDLSLGLFCKIEFTSGINAWWAVPALQSLRAVGWFPYVHILNDRRAAR